MAVARTRRGGVPLLLLLIVVLVVAYAIRHSHGPRAGRPVPSPADTAPRSCARAQGPFRVHGTEVLQRNGTPYIPFGVTVAGLAHASYQAYSAADTAEIKATALVWCANTVRLQVSQDSLVGSSGQSYSPAFLRAIMAEVRLAERYGLVTVITAQTEDVGREPAPTAATAAFWSRLAAVYGHDPQVVFDLFNEPRLDGSEDAQTWRLWQQGGFDGSVFYLGMQNLVDEVRMTGATNLLWIEGPRHAGTLSGIASHPVTGGPLVYSIHHPVGAHNPASWWRDFGFLMTRGIAPVVVGEWSNYAASKSECWPDAPVAVPEFLTYLQAHGIGMTVWTLKPGVMVKSRNLADPTVIGPGWKCQNGLDQGAGGLVLNWFKHLNGHQPVATPTGRKP